MARPHVLATNDDGIDAVGLAVLVDHLDAAAEVTVVAPAADHSGVGRANSHEATVECDGDRTSFTDLFYDPLRPDHPATLPEDGADRAALARGEVSVSPLRSRHEVVDSDVLATAVASYRR